MEPVIHISPFLQVALFCAAIAVIIFVAMCLPAIFQLRKQADQLARELTELKTTVSRLVLDLTDLSDQARRQFDDIEQVIHTMRGWVERVNHVVEAVGDVVETPILRLARNAHIYRAGIAKFFESFLRNNHNQPKKAESHHVR